MDYMALIGMIGQLYGKSTGDAASKIPQDQLMAILKGAVDDYGKINVPQLQQLILQKAPDTQLAGIKDDPQYRQQQMTADAQLNDIINSGGLTLADKAALSDIRAKVLRGESAGRGAITNEMAQRGSLDSGNQLAMQLAQQQNAAQSENQAGENTAGQAQARMYAAIQERARQAGQGLDRSYNQQANAARAQDAINQGNVAIANTASKYNAGLGQQDFQNQLTLANSKLNPAYTLAGAYGAQANQARQSGQDTGNIIAAGANAFGSQNKTNNSGFNSSEYTPPPSTQASGSWDTGDQYYIKDPGFQDYPGASSDSLTSQSTKPSDGSQIIVGYDAQGNPIYGYRKA